MKYSFFTKPGRLQAAGDASNWSRFLFTPEQGELIPLQMKAGGEAFLLHGILHLQPGLTVEVEFMTGHPVVFATIAPAFCSEFEFPGQGRGIPVCLSGMVSRARNAPPPAKLPPAPDPASVSPAGQMSSACAIIEARKNHHPTYTFALYQVEDRR